MISASTILFWLSPLLGVLIAAVGIVVAVRYVRTVEERVAGPLHRQIALQENELKKEHDVSEARNVFLAALSHELRTPLSGIVGAVQLLQDTGLDARQQEYAHMIDYASATVLEIVDDMLTFSRIRAGKVRVDRVPFSVHSVVDDMLALQMINARARGIALVRDLAPDVPHLVLGDRGKLNQILLNVIGNAVKFTDEGSVTIHVQCVPVQPGAPAQGGHVRLRFTVQDTGIGMDAETVRSVFQPFHQGGGESAVRRGGTGLGLTICQRLIDAMDGEIRIDSTPGVGSCVCFELTFTRASADAGTSARPFRRKMRERSLTVLVIEDDEINRLVCTRYLALLGHHPLAAADRRQVWNIVRYSNRVPDVILMDMNLGGRSGAELAADIAAGTEKGWKDAPVVAMSADVSGAAQKEARWAGMKAFLAKPFTAAQLSAALESAVAEIQTLQADQTGFTDGAFDGLLDEAYLEEEVGVLGRDVMLELLNIFRASAATIWQEVEQGMIRHDWRLIADLAHRLQGSAANLGMQQLAVRARALQHQVLQTPVGPDRRFEDEFNDLQALAHVSSDALRAYLLAPRHQGVPLTTDRDD